MENLADQLLPFGIQRIRNYMKQLSLLGLPAHLVFNQKYRRALATTQLNLLPPTMLDQLRVVVDVGANLGEWSIGMACLTQPETIISYEPIPIIFKQLVQNCHRFQNIQCINAAVGSRQGTTKINVYETHQLSSILELGDLAKNVHGMAQERVEEVQVPIHSLDQDLDKYEEISILKLDVQGYEPEVLKGARNILQKTKILLTEITYSPYYRGDLQFADFHKLVISSTPLQLWSLSEPHNAPSGRSMWADAVYIHPVLFNNI